MRLHIKEILFFGVLMIVSAVSALFSSNYAALQNIFIGIFSSSLVVLFLSLIAYKHDAKDILDLAFVRSHCVYNDLRVIQELYIKCKDTFDDSIKDLDSLRQGSQGLMSPLDAVFDKCIDGMDTYNTIFYKYSSFYKWASTKLQLPFYKKFSELFKEQALRISEKLLSKDYSYMSLMNMYMAFDMLKKQNIRHLSTQWLEILLLSTEISTLKLRIKEKQINGCYSEEASQCDDELIIQNKLESLHFLISELQSRMENFKEVIEKYVPLISNGLGHLAVACGVSSEWEKAKTQTDS